MGGTAIHMIYANKRFSEDLDFDNLGLTKRGFEELVKLIKRGLGLEGYTIETKNVFRGAYRSYLRVPNILFDNGLSRHREEKMLIQIDVEPQEIKYTPDKMIINKFDVFLQIRVVPPDILLAQKFYAIFKRNRAMGRDFYDAVFLFGMTKPNLEYLNLKLGIKDMADLKRKLLLKCKSLDFKQLAKDVEPFLFTPNESKKILLFPDYIKSR
jgi:predicted nucleotidyltransferase component of viral defense system